MRASFLLTVLVEAVSPSLRDSLASPDVVRVLGQPIDQLLHLGGQLDGAQVEGCGFVPVRLLQVGLVGQTNRANASRWFVHGNCVSECNNGSKTKMFDLEVV